MFLYIICPLCLLGKKAPKSVPLTASVIFVSEDHVVKSETFKGNC